MVAKYWKKIGLIILIVACVFNVMSKLVNRISLNQEMISSAIYSLQHNNEEENNEN